MILKSAFYALFGFLGGLIGGFSARLPSVLLFFSFYLSCFLLSSLGLSPLFVVPPRSLYFVFPRSVDFVWPRSPYFVLTRSPFLVLRSPYLVLFRSPYLVLPRSAPVFVVLFVRFSSILVLLLFSCLLSLFVSFVVSIVSFYFFFPDLETCCSLVDRAMAWAALLVVFGWLRSLNNFSSFFEMISYKVLVLGIMYLKAEIQISFSYGVGARSTYFLYVVSKKKEKVQRSERFAPYQFRLNTLMTSLNRITCSEPGSRRDL